jgi:serine/threonine protein kinase
MLLEFCPNGSLIDVIYRKTKNGTYEKRPSLSAERVLELFEMVVTGVAHMHAQVRMLYARRRTRAAPRRCGVGGRTRRIQSRRSVRRVCMCVALWRWRRGTTWQSPPVTHRDLKLENVLGAADGRFVLCDFGSATTAILPAERTRKASLAEEEKIAKYSTLMCASHAALRRPEAACVPVSCGSRHRYRRRRHRSSTARAAVRQRHAVGCS